MAKSNTGSLLIYKAPALKKWWGPCSAVRFVGGDRISRFRRRFVVATVATKSIWYGLLQYEKLIQVLYVRIIMEAY